MQKSANDRAFERIVRVFDRAGFQVWNPNGHLNEPLQDSIGALITDDNPAWNRGIGDDFPLTAKIGFTTTEEASALLTRMKESLKKRGFSISAELPHLSDGFSALAEGVVAKKVRNGVTRKDELHITISELPVLTQ